jgi:hypothetical protein
MAGTIHGLKRHDYHIIMERLLSVMLRGYLDDEIKKRYDGEVGEGDTDTYMQIRKKIFPPGWFNPMQHLLVHIPYEAKVGGPVQYRWMHHIERALKYLRAMVSNKARVEGSITESFLLKEITYFLSVYFAEEHNVNALILRYNVNEEPPLSDLKIFQWEAQLQAAARPIIILKKDERLLCSTCIAIWKRWICFFM